MEEKKLVGVEITEKKVEVVDQDLVGSIGFAHVGKIGSLEANFKGKISFLPFANKAIDVSVDFVEKKIPGDQTAAAEMVKVTLKGFLAKIKL